MITLALALFSTFAGEQAGLANPAGQAAAQSLVRQVADAANSTKTWRAEGRIVTETKTGADTRTTTRPFRITQSGRKFRYETGTGPGEAITTFDGTSVWAYAPQSNTYSARAAEGQIASPVLNWERFERFSMADWVAAGLGATDSGGNRPCEVLNRQAGANTTSVCIDRINALILWSRETSAYNAPGGAASQISQTVWYDKIERDIPLDDSLFQFQPPTGARGPGAPNMRRTPPAGVYRPGGGVTVPRIETKVEPSYTMEARGAKYQGTVILHVVIGTDGVARDITLERPLGMGLDEMATEAVQQWRFRPGTLNGEPVAVEAMIEVNFRLL